MKKLRVLTTTIAAVLAPLALHATAGAATLNVPATSNVFGAGHTAAPGGGTLPPSIALSGGNSSILMFSSVSGSITLNGGTFNDADGVGAAVGSSSTTSVGGISGITAPNAGYLVGVFEPASEPADPAPASLNFITTGTSFSTLSPLLNQTFFIGDGLTGDMTGAIQQFVVPAGATRLFLGISDAPGYNGSPGSYADNSGTFVATFTVVPEPGTIALSVLAAAGLLAMRPRRSAASVHPGAIGGSR